MNPPVEKHIPYYELLESLQRARICALCEMRENSTSRYLESLLYESVNDAGVRSRLVKSWGFCRRHAEKLLEFRDALGISLLYQDQVNLILEFLASLESMGRKALRNALLKWENHADCPVCVLEMQSDAQRIGTLLSGLGDSELRQALEQSPGFCIPHLLDILIASKDDSIRLFLIELHQGKFSRLYDELKEFCRKNDYRFSQEKYGSEADAWQRVSAMIQGR